MPGLEWTAGACLHDVLARAAVASPDGTALVSGDTSYTLAPVAQPPRWMMLLRIVPS